MTWRVDYAAREHPYWLSLEKELFPDVQEAIRQAMFKWSRWEPCVGWRVVKMTVPPFQKIIDDHLYKIIDEAGNELMPWTLKPWPGREKDVARAA